MARKKPPADARDFFFLWPLPSASAPRPKTAATSPKANQEEKQHRTNGGVYNRGDNAGTQMDTDSRQQQIADECADNAYYEIADESKSGAAHDLSGQPAGNKTDHQDDQKTFI